MLTCHDFFLCFNRIFLIVSLYNLMLNNGLAISLWNFWNPAVGFRKLMKIYFLAPALPSCMAWGKWSQTYHLGIRSRTSPAKLWKWQEGQRTRNWDPGSGEHSHDRWAAFLKPTPLHCGLQRNVPREESARRGRECWKCFLGGKHWKWVQPLSRFAAAQPWRQSNVRELSHSMDLHSWLLAGNAD